MNTNQELGCSEFETDWKKVSNAPRTSYSKNNSFRKDIEPTSYLEFQCTFEHKHHYPTKTLEIPSNGNSKILRAIKIRTSNNNEYRWTAILKKKQEKYTSISDKLND